MPYSTDFPVRGLLIDKRLGHVLKMNRYKLVTKGYHGLRELGKEELRQLYHSRKIRPATPRFHWIDTLYALSEAALYAAIVEAMTQRGMSIDYAKTFTDIREGIDEAHRDGTILETVAADFPRFLNKDHDLAPTLHKLRSAGQEALRPDELALVVHRQDDDVPARRRDERVPALAQLLRRRRRRRDEAGVLPGATALDGARRARRRAPRARRRSRSSAGKIYEGGNLHDLERGLGGGGRRDPLRRRPHLRRHPPQQEGERLAHGDDHPGARGRGPRPRVVPGGLRARRVPRGRARPPGGRAPLLPDALQGALAAHGPRARRRPAKSERPRARPRPSARASSARSIASAGACGTSRRSSRVIERRVDQRFHPYWGSLLKEENEQSSFGAQVEEYACLYTSRVSDFLLYSPQQYFRSPRDEMAHELG